jgi:hypothetical protein
MSHTFLYVCVIASGIFLISISLNDIHAKRNEIEYNVGHIIVCPILKSVITLYETYVIQADIGAMHYWISTMLFYINNLIIYCI